MAHARTTTTTTGGGLFGRKRRTTKTTTVESGPTATAHHHHKRRASLGDKISGAMMKLRGSLTRRPGLKAAGTRRMHGTDGRGSHRY